MVNKASMTDNLSNSITLDDILAIFFIIGLTIIYIPQYYKIYKNKSSYGFSPWFIFMGYCGAFLSWVNGGIFYIDNWRECHGGLNCTQHLTGIFLIIFQWLLFFIMYIMYVYYYRKDEVITDRSRLLLGDIHKKRLQCCNKTAILFGNNTKASIITYFILSQLIGLISLGITIYFISQGNWSGEKLNNTLEWSQFLSTVTSLMFCLHYLPQIYKTIKLGKVGSLSLVTLGIMCPGTFIWTYFLARQSSVTSNSPDSGNPSIWVPFLVVGFLQVILLTVGVYYEWHQRKINKYLLDLECDGDILPRDEII